MVPATLLAAAQQITRDGAREDAAEELRNAVYRAGEPSLMHRAARRFLEWLGELIGEVLLVVPGGLTGLTVVVVVLVALIVLVRLGRSAARARDPLRDRRERTRAMTAADYRAEAERYAAAKDWREALRARFRAVIRELEQRGVLDPRPGRTAGEIAAEGGRAVPEIGNDLRRAAHTFDEVWYGGRAATPAHYDTLCAVDDRVRLARLVTAV